MASGRRGKATGNRRTRVHSDAKSAKSRPSPNMTYFEDRGSVYDAPIDTVWDFVQKDEEFHPQAHAMTLRNWEEKQLSEVTKLVRYEQEEGGRWRQFVARLTEIRPAVRITETLEGPYAGSTMVFLYTPRGRRTVVDVLCYMRSSELSPEEMRRRKMHRLAGAYKEDLPYFRRFVRKHRPARGSRS